MASTDTPAVIRPLTTADLAAAVHLSASANWNQNLDDWSMILRLGQGWGIDEIDADGHTTLAASAVVLPYGAHFAWVSMVLVLPAFRRRGHAQRLLRHALAQLRSRHQGAVLDATPAGHAVYVQEGFVDTWSFARYRRHAGAVLHPCPDAAPSRPLREADWPAIDAIDSPAFGASRLPLLRELARRSPQAARVVEQGGRVCGFVLGREGREAHQIGPLLADDEAAAKGLVQEALRVAPGAVYLDLLDRQQALLPWLHRQGFGFQRPFTRMVHALGSAPGDPSRIVLAAGPELG